jgi:hypothetical protein
MHEAREEEGKEGEGEHGGGGVERWESQKLWGSGG